MNVRVFFTDWEGSAEIRLCFPEYYVIIAGYSSVNGKRNDYHDYHHSYDSFVHGLTANGIWQEIC